MLVSFGCALKLVNQYNYNLVKPVAKKTKPRSVASAKSQRYAVYIIQCLDGTLYTGITNNLPQRLALHRSGRASHYTRARGVKRLRYTQTVANRSVALKREYVIKQLTRQAKLQLIFDNHHPRRTRSHVRLRTG